MASRSDDTGIAPTAQLPEPEELLRNTDWANLRHARGTAEDVPVLLAALLDADPAEQGHMLADDLEPVRRENTIYPATPPTAQYIAAILPDPRTATRGTYPRWDRPVTRQRPLRAALLDWLGLLGMDADDKCAKICKRSGFEHPDMDEIRALRPAFYYAAAAFLHDEDSDVRHAAFAAAAPFSEALELACQRAGLMPCAHDVLASSTDRFYISCANDYLADEAEVPTDSRPPSPDPCF